MATPESPKGGATTSYQLQVVATYLEKRANGWFLRQLCQYLNGPRIGQTQTFTFGPIEFGELEEPPTIGGQT